MLSNFSCFSRYLLALIVFLSLNGLTLAHPGPRATPAPLAKDYSSTRLLPTPAPLLSKALVRRDNSTSLTQVPGNVDSMDLEWLSRQAQILSAMKNRPVDEGHPPNSTDPNQDPPGPNEPHGFPTTVDCTLCYITRIVPLEADCASTTIPGCTTPPPPPPPPPPAPTPTGVVELSNNSVAIGDSHNSNGGADLRTNLLNGLKGLCPDSSNQCTTTTTFEIPDIGTVVDGKPQWMKLIFTVLTSQYAGTMERDRMIAMAVASWEQAAAKSCSEVDYRDWGNPEDDGCGDDSTGPIKRDILMSPAAAMDDGGMSWRDTGPLLDKRLGPGGCLPTECLPEPHECDYKANVCAAPNFISITLGDGENDPYANHLDISIEAELEGETWAEWFCENIAPELPELAMALFPELAPADVALGEMVLQVVCNAVDQDLGVDQG